MRNGEFSKEKLLSFSSQLAYSEAVAQTCSVKKVFLEISQNLQEHTCARVVAHRTPLVFWWFSMKTISEWFSQNTSGGCFCLLSEAVSLRCSVKTMFSKISQNSQKSNSLFFNKVAVFRPATLSRTGLWRRCFPVNSAKFLRTLFYRTLQQLFLYCLLTRMFHNRALAHKINRIHRTHRIYPQAQLP